MFSVVCRAKTMFGYCLQQFSFSLSGHTRTACIVEHLITKAVVSLCLCSINANRKKNKLHEIHVNAVRKKSSPYINSSRTMEKFVDISHRTIERAYSKYLSRFSPFGAKKSTRKTAASVSYFMMFFFLVLSIVSCFSPFHVFGKAHVSWTYNKVNFLLYRFC